MIEVSEFLVSEGYLYSVCISMDNTNEASSWCRKEIGENLEWIELINVFHFKDKETFIRFKLTWK